MQPSTRGASQRLHSRLLTTLLRRRRWALLALLLCIVLAMTLACVRLIDIDLRPERDTYLDNVPEELYRAVLSKWYDFADGEKWYNKRNVSTLSPAELGNLLTDVRRNWILWNHNTHESYALQDSNIEDPSMGQSTVIREIFDDKKNGFFIECGAYDGETRSNTLFLERFRQWSGLLIEADPINFTKMLQKNRRAYLSPTCLSITGKPALGSFLMARNIGRLHESDNSTAAVPANTADVAHTGEHIHVQCLPLALYIDALGIGTVDYFSLDIEGNEIDVLETLPFNEVDIKVLSVEYIHNAKGQQYMIDMMQRRGYYVYSFVEQKDNLANDIIFVKRDA